MEVPQRIEEILGYLRGGDIIETPKLAKENPELLARCITYVMKEKYHRRNTIRAVIDLLNNSPTVYKGIAWQLIQKMPLSYILELMKIMYKNDNTKRLRHSIAVKLSTDRRNQILRAFFMRPSAFRSLFEILYLPRSIFKDKEIINENYKLAYRLSQLSIHQAVEELKLSKADLLTKLHLPLEQVMNLIENPAEASGLAKAVQADSFFHHSRWFKEKLDKDEYESIAVQKVDKVKNPMAFVSIQAHLEETNSMTPKLYELLDEKAKNVMTQIMEKFKLDRIALIVDISGSMEIAINITQKLYEAFSKSSNILEIIAFNERAVLVDKERLKELKANGGTSIGASIVLLKQRLDKRREEVKQSLRKESMDVVEDMMNKQIPQAIIMVTDLEENISPYLDITLQLLKEYGDPPLIILLCGVKKRIPINYPSAIIEVDDFHEKLIMQVMQQIARATSKVAVKEKAMTKILVKRKPIEEEIGSVELINRPEETLKKGYLEKLLCNTSFAKKIQEEKEQLISEKDIDEARAQSEKRLQEKREKIEQMLKVSNKIKLKMMRNALEMDKRTFNEEIFKLAEDFGFFIDGDNLIINADKKEGFMEKLDKIIEQNELILGYTEKIEEIIDSIDDLEDFLIKKLGSDFEKIKNVWTHYKEGNIGKSALIKEGAKVIGKKFVKIFLKK